MPPQMEFRTHDLLDVAIHARDNIHSIESTIFWIAIPLALLPPIPIKWKWIWLRTFVVTLVLWIVLMSFRMNYEVPWNRIVMDIEKKDFGYDGVGGNAVLLLVGWMFPFAQSLITLCVTRCILIRIGTRKRTSTEPSS